MKMNNYFDFDTCDQFKEYYKKHFRMTKPLQVSIDRNSVYEGFWLSDSHESSVIVKWVRKRQVYMIYDDSLDKFVHKDYFFLKHLSKHNICPQPMYYFNTPGSAHIVIENLSDDWLLLSDYIYKSRNCSKYPQIIKNIIEIIKMMNENNVYYTDTKSDNIMINRVTLEIKFIDFEDAIMEKNQLPCMSNLKAGTIGYCAPEVLAGKHYNVEKSQIFTIGCLIFSFYEKYIPFKTIADTKSVKYVISGKCPKDVSNIIRSCLVFEPDERPSMENLLNENWIVHQPAHKPFLTFLSEFWKSMKEFICFSSNTF